MQSGTTTPESTPPFLLWTLAHPCPFRQIEQWESAERTERHLRAAQAASLALAEGRVHEGIAIRGEYGFRVEEALAFYGGPAALQATCCACPANANIAASAESAPSPPSTFAGCFGMVPLPELASPCYQQLETEFLKALPKHGQPALWPNLLKATQPRPHGLWLAEVFPATLTSALAEALQHVAPQFPSHPDASPSAVYHLIDALHKAHQFRLPLHLNFFPSGTRTKTLWCIPATCPVCHVAWSATAPGICSVCHFEGHPFPFQQRRARGNRPYFPLTRLKRTS